MPSVDFSSANSFYDSSKILDYHTNKYNALRYNRDSRAIISQLELYSKLIFDRDYSLILDSGMRAITVAINSVLRHINKIFIPKEVYRKTTEYCEYLLTIGAIDELCVYENKHLLFEEINERSLLIIESFSNPHLIVTDFEKIQSYKDNNNCIILLDSTFSGLANHKIPLGFIDIEIQSLTKYASGYNDVIAGVITTNNEAVFKECWNIRSREGGILDSMSGYLLVRSLRDYDLRWSRQLQNAAMVYNFLAKSNKIENIIAPGKQKDIKQNNLFNKYYINSGSVMSFVSKMRVEDLMEVFQNFNSIKIAPSFGSIDTLIEIPSIMSHFDKDELDLEKIGLERNLIRISIGCEPIDMIIQDLKAIAHG